MKWFKHYVDLLDDDDIQFAIDKHGPTAGYAFMRLMEYLAKIFNPQQPGIFLVSRRVIFSKMFPKSSHKTGKKILETFQDLGKFKYKIRGKEIIFNCDLIKDLADEYTRKQKKRAGS